MIHSTLTGLITVYGKINALIYVTPFFCSQRSTNGLYITHTRMTAWTAFIYYFSSFAFVTINRTKNRTIEMCRFFIFTSLALFLAPELVKSTKRIGEGDFR